MTCCSRRVKNTEKRIKKNIVMPLPSLENIEVQEYIEHTYKECIICHHCKKMFNLQFNEINIICAKCDHFYHCNIAGKCRGKNCTEIVNNEIKTLSYCLNCVNHMTCIEDTCLCNECIIEEKK